jgi:hypothetical protein
MHSPAAEMLDALVVSDIIFREGAVDRPDIRPSALRHGISEERMRHVVGTCRMPLDHPDGSGLVIYLGPGQRGVPLEVAGFQDDTGHVTVIHAMRLRPSYRGMYKEVMRWL